jgi:hypothetical protein
MFYSDGNLSIAEADERVRNGSDWITHELGEGWVTQVDRDDFDITDPYYCLAPMVFGENWDVFPDRFGVTVYETADFIIEHGFDVYSGQEEDGEVLNAAWQREFDRLSA